MTEENQLNGFLHEVENHFSHLVKSRSHLVKHSCSVKVAAVTLNSPTQGDTIKNCSHKLGLMALCSHGRPRKITQGANEQHPVRGPHSDSGPNNTLMNATPF